MHDTNKNSLARDNNFWYRIRSLFSRTISQYSKIGHESHLKAKKYYSGKKVFLINFLWSIIFSHSWFLIKKFTAYCDQATYQPVIVAAFRQALVGHVWVARQLPAAHISAAVCQSPVISSRGDSEFSWTPDGEPEPSWTSRSPILCMMHRWWLLAMFYRLSGPMVHLVGEIKPRHHIIPSSDPLLYKLEVCIFTPAYLNRHQPQMSRHDVHLHTASHPADCQPLPVLRTRQPIGFEGVNAVAWNHDRLKFYRTSQRQFQLQWLLRWSSRLHSRRVIELVGCGDHKEWSLVVEVKLVVVSKIDISRFFELL